MKLPPPLGPRTAQESRGTLEKGTPLPLLSELVSTQPQMAECVCWHVRIKRRLTVHLYTQICRRGPLCSICALACSMRVSQPCDMQKRGVGPREIGPRVVKYDQGVVFGRTTRFEASGVGALASAPPCFKRLVQHDDVAQAARSGVLDVPLLLRDVYRRPGAVGWARGRLHRLQQPTWPSGSFSGENVAAPLGLSGESERITRHQGPRSRLSERARFLHAKGRDSNHQGQRYSRDGPVHTRRRRRYLSSTSGPHLPPRVPPQVVDPSRGGAGRRLGGAPPALKWGAARRARRAAARRQRRREVLTDVRRVDVRPTLAFEREPPRCLHLVPISRVPLACMLNP